MKFTVKFFSVLALAVGLFAIVNASAHEGHDEHKAAEHAAKGKLVPVTDKNAPWYVKAKADYPTDACVVSEDKLEGGEMGKPQDFIYQEEGKPDRLVRLCCKDCVKDFKKDPDKFLKMLDEAAAKKAKGST